MSPFELADIRCVHAEFKVRMSLRGSDILARLLEARAVDVASRRNIPELHGDKRDAQRSAWRVEVLN